MSGYYIRIHKSSYEDVPENNRITIDELPFQPLILERLAALGVIDIQESTIPIDQVDRVAKILRLRQFLRVNLSGAAVICELLDRLEEQDDEIKRLKRQRE
ncbi:MAG: chaperone modulator CbpM [Eubacteriales bacterium]|nr:chaperone modulator CbpM [Eubacteriales bacterium]